MDGSRSGSRGSPSRGGSGGAAPAGPAAILTMRLGVLILRKNYYRLLGPVVEEALRRGYDVECWHDWSGPRRGAKSSEFPDTPPVFAAGTPRVTGYGGTADLAERWRR